MTYLHAVAEAIASQRYRHLPAGSAGIARAILARDKPRSDDWEMLAGIVSEALRAEALAHAEAIEADADFDRRVASLAHLPVDELRRRLDALPGSTGPEVRASGTRSTYRATANEAARGSFGERRVLERAIALTVDGSTR